MSGRGYRPPPRGLSAFSSKDEDTAPTQPKRRKFEDDFFDEDDEEQVNVPTNSAKKEEEDDEPDPLDAFMAGIGAELKKEPKPSAGPKLRRDDIEEEDPVESFLKHRDQEKMKKELDGGTAELEYDMDDNPILKKKQIEVLAPLDHTKIEYEEFEKNFYDESEEIANMTDNEVTQLRRKLDVRVSGDDPIRPVQTFEQLGFDKILMREINNMKFTEPTPIQKQAVPTALSGRDLIGIAKTGSGKTASFVWPMITHIMDQRELRNGEGPIAIVVAPTRELAAQIYVEAKRYSRGYGIKVAALLGGISKGDQWKTLRSQQHEIAVCTPGRLIDMIKMKAVKMNRVTFLVLDEADRMFDMGFEPQIRSIVGQIRPDRQTMLFSATFAPSIEELARDILKDPVKITVGSHGAANEDVTQVVLVMDSDQDKWTWLITNIHRLVQEGSLLIFAGMKSAVDELSARLQIMNYTVAGIHGDKDFNERLKIMHAFKSGAVQIMVATDVAARGLDVKSVKNVVNFAVARNIDDHVHRIGRTGRAGEKGVATTLILHKECDFAGKLVRNLEQANQIVPPELLAVAMRSPRFKVGRHTRGGKAGRGRGGARGGGLGFGHGGNRGDQGALQGPRPVHPEDQHRHQGPGPQPGGYARDARAGFNRFVSSSEQYSSIGQGAPNAPRPQPNYEPPAGYVVDDYDPLNPTSDEAAQVSSTPLNSEGKPMSLKEQFLAQFQGKLPFPQDSTQTQPQL